MAILELATEAKEREGCSVMSSSRAEMKVEKAEIEEESELEQRPEVKLKDAAV